MLVNGTFERVHRGGRKSPKIDGQGTLGIGAEGLALSGHRDRPLLGFLAGAAGFVLGIILVIALTLALDSFADIDLMTMRKGPGLIGMGALALGLGLAGGFRTVVGWLFGRLAVDVSIARDAVEGISLNGQQLAILWETDAANHAILFTPAAGETSAAALHATLTGRS